MDIIKLYSNDGTIRMEFGKIINGIKSKMWIERYREAGEFTLTAPISSGLKQDLPIGSFITHKDTVDIMIVENHEIRAVEDKEDEIVVTGRGFETFLENRIVGSNRAFPLVGEPQDYQWIPVLLPLDIILLMQKHMYASELLNDQDEVPYVTVRWEPYAVDVVFGEVRKLGRVTLYDAVQELLTNAGAGIKVARPMFAWSPLTFGDPNTAMTIHKGVDRSDTVTFSHDAGEILSADYLWSNKKYKNTALVTSKWVQLIVGVGAWRYARRVMTIDASEIDKEFETAPTGTDLDDVVTAMQAKAVEILSTKQNVAITKAEVAKAGVSAQHRLQYNVGDIIGIIGDYNQNTKMRVIEYVEIEDSTGEHGYPTLALDETA